MSLRPRTSPRRPSPEKRRLRREELWCDRHDVNTSRHNSRAPRTRRIYFDHLPIVTVGKAAELDMVTAAPTVFDGHHSHTEQLLRSRFIQFPQFLARGRQGRLAATQDGSVTWVERELAGGEPPRPATSSGAPPLVAALEAKPGVSELLLALERRPASPRKTVTVAAAASAAAEPSDSSAATAHRPSRPAKRKTESRLMESDEALGDTDDSHEFPGFVAWLRQRNLSLEKIWHFLDGDKNLTLFKSEFQKGLRGLQYAGDLERLWNLIDRDKSGTIKFIEFAPEAAMELALLKRWTFQTFGSTDEMFTVIDQDKSGSITWRELHQGCLKAGLPPHLEKTLHTLFTFLDTAETTVATNKLGNGLISKQELAFLDKWDCPPYLWSGADEEAGRRFKAALLAKHEENNFIVWRLILDVSGSMRVNYDEFVKVCKVLAKRGVAEADPPCGVTELYNAFDTDRSGWFTLRDWDRPTFETLKLFVEWCRSTHSSVPNFVVAAGKIPTLDDDETKLGTSFKQFSEGVKALEIPHESKVALFRSLLDPKKQVAPGTKHLRLFEPDVVFFRAWQPMRDIKDDLLWGALVNKTFTREDHFQGVPVTS